MPAGDHFIAGISSLRNLKTLNVAGTQLTNESERAIRGFPKLESFYAWGASMDEETMGRLGDYAKKNYAASMDQAIKDARRKAEAR